MFNYTDHRYLSWNSLFKEIIILAIISSETNNFRLSLSFTALRKSLQFTVYE